MKFLTPIIIKESSAGISGYFADHPNVISQGKDREELTMMLNDAWKLYTSLLKRKNQTPNPSHDDSTHIFEFIQL